jgi:hypothetical protein
MGEKERILDKVFATQSFVQRPGLESAELEQGYELPHRAYSVFSF